jgi:hypothetical protein
MAPPHKAIYTPMFIAALFIIVEIGKQPKCLSMGKWKKKLHRGILFSPKNKEILTFTDVDEPRGHYVKKSGPEREIFDNLTLVWNLINKAKHGASCPHALGTR